MCAHSLLPVYYLLALIQTNSHVKQFGVTRTMCAVCGCRVPPPLLAEVAPLSFKSLRAELKSLLGFSVSQNVLTTLPATLCTLTNLKVIDASSNHLTHLPSHLSRLTALKSLRACDNRLTLIPLGLEHLPALVDVFLQDNPLSEGIPSANARCNASAVVALRLMYARQATYHAERDAYGPLLVVPVLAHTNTAASVESAVTGAEDGDVSAATVPAAKSKADSGVMADAQSIKLGQGVRFLEAADSRLVSAHGAALPAAASENRQVPESGIHLAQKSSHAESNALAAAFMSAPEPVPCTTTVPFTATAEATPSVDCGLPEMPTEPTESPTDKTAVHSGAAAHAAPATVAAELDHTVADSLDAAEGSMKAQVTASSGASEAAHDLIMAEEATRVNCIAAPSSEDPQARIPSGSVKQSGAGATVAEVSIQNTAPPLHSADATPAITPSSTTVQAIAPAVDTLQPLSTPQGVITFTGPPLHPPIATPSTAPLANVTAGVSMPEEPAEQAGDALMGSLARTKLPGVPLQTLTGHRVRAKWDDDAHSFGIAPIQVSVSPRCVLLTHYVVIHYLGPPDCANTMGCCQPSRAALSDSHVEGVLLCVQTIEPSNFVQPSVQSLKQ
jgi:hypothetical protein